MWPLGRCCAGRGYTLPRLNVVQPLNVLFWRKAYRPVSQPPNAFVMQGLDLLGGRPRLAAQELET